MPDHLSKDLLERYIERDVRRSELDQIHDHLFGCETCYPRFLEIFGERKLPIEIDLDELAGLNRHLTAEELDAILDESEPSQTDLERAYLHLERCPQCRKNVHVLSQIEDSIKMFLTKRHRPTKKPFA